MSSPFPSETIAVDGLADEVEILVDRHGIPHIYARTQLDAFFAQGFNVARDRLWQIDVWRKRGLGRLAADYGPAFAERDRAARLLQYRGDMVAEWAAYGGDARARTEAFVAGINAYVRLTAEQPERLPVEFLMTGTRPSTWRAEDVVRCRAHARVRNAELEARRAELVARFGLEAAGLLKGLEPQWELVVPEGCEPEPVPDEVMRVYRLGTGELPFDGRDVAVPEPSTAVEHEGSNNWALAPSRTTTGRAILASDPHRVHRLPALRYMVHLCAPGLDVIGAGEPAIPGVSLGHNDRIAFGLTIFPTDQEDLYVYELDPDDPDRYRFGDGWERMRVVRETIAVRGEADREVELRFTRHGPVLHHDPDAARAWALRTVWTEPGTAAYMASLGYLDAQSWDAFVGALRGWGAPSVNHVYADVDGNIGWITAGLVPVRDGWDGLLPVPGDGRFEWNGFMPMDAHPRSYNPEQGWVGSANQMNLPDDFDVARHKTGFEFADGARFARISEVLGAGGRFGLDETRALQVDFTSITARRLCALLAPLRSPDALTAEGLGLLSRWDHVLAPASAAAALFEVWFQRHLIPATLRRLGPPGLAERIDVPDTALVVSLLERADPRFGRDPRAARDAVLLETLTAAMTEMETLLGSDRARWSWGRLHHGFFEHPLSAVAGPLLRHHLDVGPVPKGGSGLTVNNNGYRATDFRVVSGVSWRMVVDVGDWDRCLTINAPGQSGDPRSPHYRDMLDAWSREAYVPMPYSRAAVEASTGRRIVLRPAPAESPDVAT